MRGIVRLTIVSINSEDPTKTCKSIRNHAIRGVPKYFIFAVLALIPIIASLGQDAQSVPQAYQRFFVRHVDNRSLFEKMLNQVGLSSRDVSRSFALVAGVSHYPNMPTLQQELKPAAEDLQHLETYLRQEEIFDEIVVLRDGDMNYENLRYFLEVYFPARLQKSPKSRFLFAYSGHGISDGRNAYLLLSSARNFNDKTNAINLSVVRELVDDVVDSGYQVLVLLNSCYSGAFLRRPFGPSSLRWLRPVCQLRNCLAPRAPR